MEASRSLTVVLTDIPYQMTYDKEAFLNHFPSSLIAATYDLTGEDVIPLTHSDVTPAHLEILQDILEGKILQPLSPDLRKGFNYLNVDLPEVIFNEPAYAEFQQYFPKSNLLDSSQLEEKYDTLVTYAVNEHNYSLLQYIYAHTKPANHIGEDRRTFETLLRSRLRDLDSEIRRTLIYLIRDRDVLQSIRQTPQSVLLGGYPVLQSVVQSGYPEVLQSYVDGLSIPRAEVARYFGYLLIIIFDDPGNFIKYVRAIIYMVQNYPVNPILYNTFRAMYTGDISLLPREFKIEDSMPGHGIVQGLLYTAALTNHPEVLVEFYHRFLMQGYASLTRSFFFRYLGNPRLIQPDILRVITAYAKRQDRRTGIDLLNEQGYPELAKIITNE